MEGAVSKVARAEQACAALSERMSGMEEAVAKAARAEQASAALSAALAHERDLAASLRTRAKQLEGELASARGQGRQLTDEGEATKRRLHEAEAKLAATAHELAAAHRQAQRARELEHQLDVLQKRPPIKALDEEGIEVLEAHMIKLSELVRQKDQTIRVLEATVHRQCVERTEMLKTMERH
jgi:septal ring factor EnvC (AmiA/AmiB activator)